MRLAILTSTILAILAVQASGQVIVTAEPTAITAGNATDIVYSVDVEGSFGETGIGGVILAYTHDPGLQLMDFEWLGALAGPDYFSDGTLPGPQTVYLGTPGAGASIIPGTPVDVARLTVLADNGGSYNLDSHMIFAEDLTFEELLITGDDVVTIEVTPGGVTEACCFVDESCQDLATADCATAGGTPQGPGSACSDPGICVVAPVTEACCLADGTCQDLETADCTTAGGTSQGAGTVCATTVCPGPGEPLITVTIDPLDIPAAQDAKLTISVEINAGFGETGIGGIITLISAEPGLNLVDFVWLGALAGPDYFSDDSLPGPQTVFLGTPGAGVPLLPGTPVDVGSLTVHADAPGMYDLDLNLTFANDVDFGEFPVVGDAVVITATGEVQNEACCFPDGTCQDLSAADCATAGGTSQGAGTDCATTTCPVTETVACCFADGSCQDLTAANCTAGGGTSQGPGTDCATTTCPVTETVACCFADGSCQDLTAANCTAGGGTSQGPGTDCATTTCPVTETVACCFPDGSCQDLTAANCTAGGGTSQGPGTDCGTTTCPVTETVACCFADGSCQDLTVANCTAGGGTSQGPGTDCGTTTCPVTETVACCFADGTCQDLTVANCTAGGGASQGPGTDCGTTTCPVVVTEACCFTDGSCDDLSTGDCTAAGGTSQGPGTDCATTVCPGQAEQIVVTITPVDIGVNEPTDLNIAVEPTAALGETGIGGIILDITSDAGLNLVEFEWLGALAGPDYFSDGSLPGPQTVYLGTPGAGVPVVPGTPVDVARLRVSADAAGDYNLDLNMIFAEDETFAELPVKGDSVVISATEVVVTEACCFEDGTCQDLAAADCTAGGGIPQGVGTDCSTTTCPVVVTEACCFTDLTCQDLAPADCLTAGGDPQGSGTVCATTVCEAVAAQIVVTITPQNIPVGVDSDLTIAVEPTAPLGETGIGGIILDIAADAGLNLVAFEWLGALAGPDYFFDNSLPGPQTVYLGTPGAGVPVVPGTPVDVATLTVNADSPGQYNLDLNMIFAEDMTFAELPVKGDNVIITAGDVQTQACCFANGTCEDLDASACTAAGGTPQGAGTVCSTTTCPVVEEPEACCFGDTCDDLLPSACTAAGGTPAGPDTTCSDDPNPCCDDTISDPVTIVESTPFSGYIDPRDDSTGVTMVEITFSEAVFAVGGAAEGIGPEDFTVTVTGGGSNSVVAVDSSANPVIVVTLASPVLRQEWTTIIANVADCAGNVIVSEGNLGPGVVEADRVDLSGLPCDINQDGICQPLDLLRFRQFANGLYSPVQGADELYFDIDRDGVIEPFDVENVNSDLNAFRDLVNGTGPATMPWAGETLNNPQP